MKKILLATAVAFGALTANAQTWTAPATWSTSFTPADTVTALSGVHTLVLADSSVVVTGTYNATFTLGNTTLTNDDKMVRAFIAKYDAKGNVQWLRALDGSALIMGADADSEGNIYVVGDFAGELNLDASTTLKGQTKDDEYTEDYAAGFIAKYDKDGNVTASHTFVPVTPAASTGYADYYAMYSYYFHPSKIKYNNGRVYVSAMYLGDVQENGVTLWPGCVIELADWGMSMDVERTGGVLSLDASLSNAQSEVLYRSDVNPAAIGGARNISFDVDNNQVYAVAQGSGTFYAFVGGDSTKVELQNTNDESGNYEHAFVATNVADKLTKTYHVAMNAEEYGTDIVNNVVYSNGNLYVGGTYYNQLGFNTSLASKGSADMFVAKLAASSLEPAWAVTSGYDEGDVNKYEEHMYAMDVKGDTVFVSGVARDKASYATQKVLNYNVVNGKLTASTDTTEYSSVNSNANGVTATASTSNTTLNLNVYEASSSTGIAGVKTNTGKASSAIYSLSGMKMGNSLDKLPKGIYVVNGKKIVK